MGNDPGLFRWIHYNHKGAQKKDAGESESGGAVRAEAQGRVMRWLALSVEERM